MSRPTAIDGPLAALVAHAGGVEALADALGVSRLTVYRWWSGDRTPSTIAARAVNDWAKRRRLPEPFPEAK